MKNSTVLIVSVICVLASLVFVACDLFQNKESSLMIDTSKYVEATATVTAVYPVRITRYGAKQPRYDIQFVDASGKTQRRFRCTLGEGYKVNDKVQILYHPEDSAAEVVLKK